MALCFFGSLSVIINLISYFIGSVLCILAIFVISI